MFVHNLKVSAGWANVDFIHVRSKSAYQKFHNAYSLVLLLCAHESYTGKVTLTLVGPVVGHNLGGEHPFHNDPVFNKGETGRIVDYI